MENLFLLLTTLLISLPTSLSQTRPDNISDSCNGLFLQYTFNKGHQLPPNITGSDPTRQPYRFESTLLVLNNGLNELKSWKAYVGFMHGELLVSATNAMLADGSPLPANVSNGTVLIGYPIADLKTGVETAGDLTLMSVQVGLVGTQFGVGPPRVPIPSNISLANDGLICPNPTMQGRNSLYTCCKMDPKAKSTLNETEEFLPRQTGDLSIIYDITAAYDSNYWAQVTISNQNPLGRLDYWQLGWDWMKEEFIYAMKGATPTKLDTSNCVFGKQADFYKSLDFSKALSCEPKPTIIDLPNALANDPTLGKVPNCCRNGTILPALIDPTKSISTFQMQVYKMPPDLNVTILNPPQNWRINGTFNNQDYQCGTPVRVSPSLIPSRNGLPVQVTAIASWQVVCNRTKPNAKPPKCCVSFSSFFNESVIPCRTCACGCSSNHRQYACNATALAIPLPSYALLIPFQNRTTITTEYAKLKHFSTPSLLPCGDNCGVSINWHLFTDHRDGWSSRITIFNWDEAIYQDWFVAVELDKAGVGIDKVNSFNSTILPNDKNTIMMHGFQTYNDYLLGLSNGTNPEKDYKRPGTVQSFILFKKDDTPGINVARGDGFPSKVIFNGEECSLPTTLPTSSANMIRISLLNSMFSLLLAVLGILVWKI